MSLLEKFKKYLQDQTTPASRATIKNYLADVGQFIKWCEDKFGYFSPKDINYVTISTYKKIKNDSGISLSSIDRHISSLRKFHTFLSISSHDIESNPFVDPISNFNNIVPTDKWSIKKFKDYLYACNSSPLTIKNYIADVRQFTNWIESHMAKNGQGIWTENLLEKIDNSLLQKYKDNLINSNISALSINRKLSSNRKYTGWAQDKGLMHFQSEIINIKKPTSQYSIPKNNNDLSSNVNMIKTNNSLYSNNDNRLKIKYSILPPIRLLQKIWNGILWILDEIFTGHIIDIIENIDYLLWKSNGKRIFVNTKKISKNIINNISSNKKLTIANISKYDYSHHEISTTSMPLHFKILHHLRNTRPNWYHKYHSYSISHYLHFAILVIVMSALGFGFYQKFIQETGTKSIALAGPISPNRVLSFQGRLTDSNDIPITSQKKLRFSIYSNETSTAAAAIEPFLWQELRIATPDADGIFSVLLGSNPTGGPTGLCGDFPATTPCGIKQSIFGDHDLLWLGVSVENDSELTPRQQIATVAFATNSELLQGLPPTIDTAWISNNTNTNAILALNSSGTLSIGGASGSKTTFQANGKYTLTGRVLSINTTAGTDTNIEITPDGIGKIDVQKPLQNSTSSNNILSSIGSVEIDDTFSVLATSSGIPAATINQNGSGDIFTASSSGNTKFTITNSGNVGIGSVMPGYKLDVTGDINVSGGFKVNGVSFTGSSQWTTNLNNSIYFNTGNVGIGTTAPIGLLHVSGSVGGNSIGIINNEGSVGDIFTASSSGNTKFTITNFGNVGIGSITPNAKLQIVGSDTSNSIFAANIGGSTGTGLIVTNSGNVGIGSVTPGYKLDVTGDINVSGGFKVNGSSFGNQWITSVNTISNSNSGNVGIGSITPNAKLQIFGDDALNTSFAANIGGNNALETGLVVTNLNNVGIGTTVPFFKLDIDGDIGPSSDNAYNIGSSSLRWGTIYANSVNIPASNGSFGPWVINGNLLSTTNPSFDLLIGGSASNSASFQIFAGTDIGINARAGDASTSGSLVFNGAASPTIDILNNQRLDFQTSSGGDTGLTARLSILGNGNVGIGTTAP
ncbi:MAG: hypothetical protein EXS44_02375, partial [Candidatus Levybacteria bacterium]|nr:hypothetical protein [Candidatus Levybacteria bacterium]